MKVTHAQAKLNSQYANTYYSRKMYGTSTYDPYATSTGDGLYTTGDGSDGSQDGDKDPFNPNASSSTSVDNPYSPLGFSQPSKDGDGTDINGSTGSSGNTGDTKNYSLFDKEDNASKNKAEDPKKFGDGAPLSSNPADPYGAQGYPSDKNAYKPTDPRYPQNTSFVNQENKYPTNTYTETGSNIFTGTGSNPFTQKTVVNTGIPQASQGKTVNNQPDGAAPPPAGAPPPPGAPQGSNGPSTNNGQQSGDGDQGGGNIVNTLTQQGQQAQKAGAPVGSIVMTTVGAVMSAQMVYSTMKSASSTLKSRAAGENAEKVAHEAASKGKISNGMSKMASAAKKHVASVAKSTVGKGLTTSGKSIEATGDALQPPSTAMIETGADLMADPFTIPAGIAMQSSGYALKATSVVMKTTGKGLQKAGDGITKIAEGMDRESKVEEHAGEGLRKDGDSLGQKARTEGEKSEKYSADGRNDLAKGAKARSQGSSALSRGMSQISQKISQAASRTMGNGPKATKFKDAAQNFKKTLNEERDRLKSGNPEDRIIGNTSKNDIRDGISKKILNPKDAGDGKDSIIKDSPKNADGTDETAKETADRLFPQKLEDGKLQNVTADEELPVNSMVKELKIKDPNDAKDAEEELNNYHPETDNAKDMYESYDKAEMGRPYYKEPANLGEEAPKVEDSAAQESKTISEDGSTKISEDAGAKFSEKDLEKESMDGSSRTVDSHDGSSDSSGTKEDDENAPLNPKNEKPEESAESKSWLGNKFNKSTQWIKSRPQWAKAQPGELKTVASDAADHPIDYTKSFVGNMIKKAIPVTRQRDAAGQVIKDGNGSSKWTTKGQKLTALSTVGGAVMLGMGAKGIQTAKANAPMPLATGANDFATGYNPNSNPYFNNGLYTPAGANPYMINSGDIAPYNTNISPTGTQPPVVDNYVTPPTTTGYNGQNNPYNLPFNNQSSNYGYSDPYKPVRTPSSYYPSST